MLKKIVVATTLAILAASSFASDRPALYMGGDVGSTKLDGLADRQTSFGAFIGYQFHENIAFEAGYRRLADFDVSEGATTVGVTIDQAALSVLGILPLRSGFNVYGRLGYNRLEAKGSAGSFTASESTSGALYGVGVGYALSENMFTRLEVQKPSSDSTNISVGIAFRF